MLKIGVNLKTVIKALAVVFAIGYIFSFSQVQAATTIGANILTDGYLKIGTAVPGAPANGMIYYDSGTNKFKCYQAGGWIDCIGTISGTLPVSSGGTGYNTFASGDLLYGNAGGTLSKLPIGANGTLLTVSGGALTWQSYDPLVITNTFPVASQVAMLAAGALKGDVAIRSDESKSYICTADPCNLIGNWAELVAPTNLALLKSNNLSDLTNAATARTNLGLGSGNSPTFNGLTLSGLTANSYIYSGAAGALTSTAAPTNGQILIGSTGLAPVLGTITGTSNRVSVTNGAGTISLSGPQDIHTGATPQFAGLTLTGNLNIDNQTELRLSELDANGANYIALKAPGTLAGDLTYTLPATYGTNGDVLASNGSGGLSWTAVSGTISNGTTNNSTLRWDSGTTAWKENTSFLVTSAGAVSSGTWNGSAIGIAYGGTNNTAAYTAGSVIFSNGTSLTQSNADLFWDDTNKRLGIGDTTPVSALTVGSGDKFQVDSSGNLVKVNNVTYNWPGSQGGATTYLQNDGSGNLSWGTPAGSGDITYVGDVATGDAFRASASGTTSDGNSLWFEGSTIDANEIQLTAADPGADVTVTIPASTGTLLINSNIGTSVQAWDAQLDDVAGLAITKGNLMVANGSNWTALATGGAGSNNYVLTADSAQASGVKWAALPSLSETDPVWVAAEPNYANLGQGETITGNWVNTANPWADNEVSDTLTVGSSGSVNAGALTLLATGTGLTSSTSGFEVSSGAIGLLQGCSNGQVLAWNEAGGTWGCSTPAASGVTSLNSLAGALTIANSSGAGSTITIDTANSTTKGLLSAADWSTFNSKQNALTIGNLSTSTTGVTIGGGTGAVIGSGATVDISTASGTATGLLTSSDWSTFNSKQNALTIGNLTAGSSKITLGGSGTGAVIGSGVSVDVNEGNLTLNNIGGTLGVTKGGTGLSSLASGDMLYASSANTLSALTKGSANQVLGMNAGGTAQEYKTITQGSGITVTHGANSITIAATASTPDFEGVYTQDADKTLTTTSNGSFAIDSGTGTISFGNTATAKTINIGGTTADGADTINIATNNTSADTVVIGNSNASSAVKIGKLATQYGLVYTSNSDGTLAQTAAGADGQILLGVSSGAPTFATMSSDATISNAGVLTISSNAVALTTDTTGNYVATITGGNGIAGSASSEGATPTLDIDLLSTNDLTGSTSTLSGLEFQGTSTDQLTLLRGCSTNQILKFDGTNWACSADSTSGGVGADSLDFTEFLDAMTLDASTDIRLGTTSTNTLTIDGYTNTTTYDNGLVFSTTGTSSAITDAIDASDADIVNALNIGANTITGTTGVIDFTNFDVSGAGAVTAGSTINGLTLSSTTLSAAGALTVSSAGSGALTLDSDSATIVLGTGTNAINTTGATALSIDTGGAAAINIGTTNANAINIGISGVTTKNIGPLQLGQNGTDGSLVIFSDETVAGADQTVTFQPNADMTQDVTYTLPPDDGTASGQVLTTNGSGALSWTTPASSGITSLNSLTASSQTFATGTTGTDFNISSGTSTHTFNIPNSSATNRGLLTSSDWTTFNSKAASGANGDITSMTAVTSITSTGALSVTSGGTNQNLTLDSSGTGSVLIGNGLSAKTITIGNSTGATALILNTGSGGITLSSLGLGIVHSSAGGLLSSSAVGLASGDVTGILPLANGGTNANLTASNGGIFYSTGSAGAILAGTATANQILLSGASTTPSWSTATYPSTAGLNGNVLTSDGTNWVSSAPSFTEADTLQTVYNRGQSITTSGGNAISLALANGGLTVTGAGAISLGDNNGTVAVNSSDWDISTAGAMTNIDSIANTGTLSVTSGTSNALSLDSGTTGDVNLGNGNNAKTLNIGSGTGGNTLNIGTGTGLDTINIGTGGTGADVINIGSSNAGAVSITSNAASTWQTTTGNLTVNAASASTLNLGTGSNAVTISATGKVTAIKGLTDLGTSTSDYVTFLGYVDSNIVPDANNTRNLGSNGNRWANVYVTGNSLHVGNNETNDDFALQFTSGTPDVFSITPAGGTAKLKVYSTGGINIQANTLPAGATGDLAIDSGASNKLKYYNGAAWVDAGSNWTDSGTTLSPLVSGRNISTTGNITTTSTGTMTSAGLLTASNGLTLSTGALNLTATSGALTLSGLGASSINTGANALSLNNSSSGAVNIGTGTGNVAIGNATGTLSLTSNGGLNVTTGGVITGSTWNGTAIAAAYGGTGQTSYTTGDLLYASGTTALSKLADVAAGSYLRSGGVSTAPLWSTLTLPNSAAQGDILYATGTNTIGNLADSGTAGSCLLSGGVGADPTWGSCGSGTGVTIANYAFLYDTATQTIGTASVYQDINLSTNGQLDGWTHTAGTANITCNQTGIYLVNYWANASRTSNATTHVEIHALFNGTEVPGSASSVNIETNNLDRPIVGNFMVSATATQILKFQLTGDGTTGNISPAASVATTKPSMQVTITRIK